MTRCSQARQDVWKAAREISQGHMVIGTWGNVSARGDDAPGFIITPSGMDYNTLTPEDMVLVGWDGKTLEGAYRPSGETPLHLAIYLARPDIHAIVHVHSPYATGYAVAGQNIPVLLEETAQAIGHEIQVVPYARCGTQDLAQNTVTILGETQCAALLANHGVIGLGASMSEALKICYVIEKTAQVGIYARILGQTNVLEPHEVQLLNRGFKRYGQKKADL